MSLELVLMYGILIPLGLVVWAGAIVTIGALGKLLYEIFKRG